jgi:hypothetical protein
MQCYLAGGAEVYCLWDIILDETGKSIDAKRPDGKTAVHLANEKSNQIVRVMLAGRAWDVILPGRSFATLLIEPGII